VQQHVGMTMIPEQTMDFSMMDINANQQYSYQPRVFAVMSLPEEPIIDAAFLSGKSSNFVGEPEHFDSEDDKIEIPIIQRQPELKSEAPTTIITPTIVDDEFDNNPEFALFVDSPASEETSEETIFGGISSEKALARIELVDAEKEEATADAAIRRVQRLAASLEDVFSRLEALTVDL